MYHRFERMQWDKIGTFLRVCSLRIMKYFCLILIHLFSVVATAAFSQTESVPIPTPKPELKRTEQFPNAEKIMKTPNGRSIHQAACPALLSGKIEGKILSPIKEADCGLETPLEITSFNNVAVDVPVVLSCGMAISMVDWVQKLQPLAISTMKSRVAVLNVSTSYQCRLRNGSSVGKVSEHGFANALDVLGFELEDGQRISVLKDWKTLELNEESDREDIGNKKSQLLKTAGKAACDYFTTVLGPESNSLHADHFHFDLGCHGKTCDYRICE